MLWNLKTLGFDSTFYTVVANSWSIKQKLLIIFVKTKKILLLETKAFSKENIFLKGKHFYQEKKA